MFDLITHLPPPPSTFYQKFQTCWHKKKTYIYIYTKIKAAFFSGASLRDALKIRHRIFDCGQTPGSLDWDTFGPNIGWKLCTKVSQKFLLPNSLRRGGGVNLGWKIFLLELPFSILSVPKCLVRSEIIKSDSTYAIPRGESLLRTSAPPRNSPCETGHGNSWQAGGGWCLPTTFSLTVVYFITL